MSDVNKVRSNAGVQYGFEDTVARQRAEEAVTIANEAKATSRILSVEGDTLVISTTVVEQTVTAQEGDS